MKKVLIVGAGISGIVLAERYASLGVKVLLLDKRDHLGGNCYDYYDSHGVLVSKYGAHIFHTNSKEVWQYVSSFGKWSKYRHVVKCWVDNQYISIPINITSINTLHGIKLKTKLEMRRWLAKNTVKIDGVKNSEEMALSRVGALIYRKCFKNYTKKQWGRDPQQLDPSVMARIPINIGDDESYFSDRYQYQPVNGFAKLFEEMIGNNNIELRLKTNFFDFRKKNNLMKFDKVFYTGPVDEFFGNNDLEYRSLKFKFTSYHQPFFQDYAVINYPNHYSYTRVVEYKYITAQKSNFTTISYEYPTDVGEPYYPVLTKKNILLSKKYQQKVALLQKDNIYFIGRLAQYQYINMDTAFSNALALFQRLESVK